MFTPSITVNPRELGDYIRKVRELVKHDEKLFACLNTIIIDFDNGRDVFNLAASIIENG